MQLFRKMFLKRRTIHNGDRLPAENITEAIAGIVKSRKGEHPLPAIQHETVFQRDGRFFCARSDPQPEKKIADHSQGDQHQGEML